MDIWNTRININICTYICTYNDYIFTNDYIRHIFINKCYQIFETYCTIAKSSGK